MRFSTKEIRASKDEALQKIKSILDAENVEDQFKHVLGDYHSKDKFIITWNDNYQGLGAEYSVDKCDSFYSSYSGYKAILVTRGPFHEKQLKGHPSIEHALIVAGMRLSDGKEAKAAFYDKYAVRYNDNLKKARENGKYQN